MFGGKDKDKDPVTGSIPTPATRSNNKSRDTKSRDTKNNSSQSQITAYLGPDVHIEGTMRFDNSVLIEGTFKGEIHSNGNLVIGENADVDAKIVTQTITIKGNVKGQIEAQQRAELKGTGSLQGDIVTPSLQMDETVFFQGSCSMPGSTGNSSSNSSSSSSGKSYDSREHRKDKSQHVEKIVQAVHTVDV